MWRRLLTLGAVLALASPGAALAVAGAPDRVPAATLLVPYFETGRDVNVNPDDTLLVVANYSTGSVRFHWHYWTVDGVATSLQGNVLLAGAATWSRASRDLIAAGPAAARTSLTVGSFYRGFVTIDVVTADTGLNPRQAGYPFGSSNVLEGYIYYTRLSEGSANGLNMLAIEAVPATINGLQRGFYVGSDNREEIDVDSRACAGQLSRGVACTGDGDGIVSRTHFRTFGSAPLNGRSRLVIFAWTLNRTKGPSQICAALGSCDVTYQYRRYNEAGVIEVSNTQRLDHVVNTLEVTDNVSGYSSFWDIPTIGNDTQFYAFSFNSANPTANPALTWDAIFEASINP